MSSTPPSALRAYIEAFDAGRYWDAHEALEERWQKDRRELWQALIQVAAAFVHVEAGRWAGAARVLRRGLGRLEKNAPVERDLGTLGFEENIDVEGITSQVRSLLAHLERMQAHPNMRFDEQLRWNMADYVSPRAGSSK